MKSSEVEIVNKYEKQANDFAEKYGIKLTTIGEPTYKKHFLADNRERWVYKMKLMRGGESYTFKFGQSYANGNKVPTMYDILACLIKYDVGSYEDFKNEFWWDRNAQSKKAYNDVCKEYEAVERLFGDIIDELSEIA